MYMYVEGNERRANYTPFLLVPSWTAKGTGLKNKENRGIHYANLSLNFKSLYKEGCLV
jgi:hypothetical protein